LRLTRAAATRTRSCSVCCACFGYSSSCAHAHPQPISFRGPLKLFPVLVRHVLALCLSPVLRSSCAVQCPCCVMSCAMLVLCCARPLDRSAMRRSSVCGRVRDTWHRRVIRASRIISRWQDHVSVSHALISLVRFTFLIAILAHWCATPAPHSSRAPMDARLDPSPSSWGPAAHDLVRVDCARTL
jgi:hypothetical protein